jgi:hypothetical protein
VETETIQEDKKLTHVTSYSRAIVFRLVAGLFCAGALAAQSIPFRINAGSSSDYTDSTARVWLADKYSVGASYRDYRHAVSTPDRELYGRIAESRTGTIRYFIPVPNGSYKIWFHFADPTSTAEGQRLMDVTVNGQAVLTGFDILDVARTGVPVLEDTPVIPVSGGRLDISFIARRGTAIVSGIEVLSAGGTPAPGPSISLTPQSVTVGANGTQQFSAAVTGTTGGVTWSLASTLAQPGTISSTGLYRAPASISGSGDVNVKATSTSNSALTAAAMVRLQSTVRVSVSPSTGTLTSGQTQQFTASVTGTSDTRVTWTATSGSISSAGLLTAPNVTSPVTATIRARSAADPAQEATATVTVNPVSAPPSPPPPPPAEVITYLESGGTVTMEPERGARISRNGVSWSPVAAPAGFGGAGALSVQPNAGVNYQTTYKDSAPEIEMFVQFANPGTYYVWARGHAPSVADDSFHVGLDDQTVPSAETISEFDVAGGGWSWSNLRMDSTVRRTISVLSPGVHKIHVWAREDGFALDRLLLTRDSAFVPSGIGPAESPLANAGPVLSLSPASLTLSATLNGSDPAAKAVTIANLGGGSLAWTAAESVSWLSVSPASGSGPGTMNVNASIAGLAAGTYTGSITIASSGATGSPKTVSVTLNVGAPASTTPVLSASPASLSFAGVAGGANPSAQTIQLSNTGGGTLSWTASESIGWLSLSASSGTAPSSIGVNVSTAGLAAGTYAGAITIAATGVTGSPKTVNVSLNVQPSGTTGGQWYVSPNGTSSGNGSISQPWSLATALAHPSSVGPGDTIWLRGGTYGTGANVSSNLRGTASSPIIVRQYPGERATINGGLTINGSDTWYWGFEVTNLTGGSRYSTRPEGVVVFGPRTRVINLVIHDTNQGISLWRPAVDAEAYGNVIYHNGNEATDRGHGHGIYTQNETGTKKIHENVVFNQFGWGLHAYGSDSAFVRNYDVRGNISFNNGSASLHDNLNDNILFTVGSSMDNIRLEQNYTYHTPSRNDGSSRLAWQGGGPHGGVVANGNYWIGGQSAIEVWNWASVEFRNNVAYSQNSTVNTLGTQQGQNSRSYAFNNNTYYGLNRFGVNTSTGDWNAFRSSTGVDSAGTFTSGRPTGVWKFARPNQYEPGRGHVVIYNWDLASTVAVDLSGILPAGSAYEIRNAQNYFAAPVATGTYSGGIVSLPMTGLSVAPVLGSGGFLQPAPTGPEFAVFVVIKK